MPKSKTTEPKAATAASKVLTDGRTAKASKSAAASALSQAGKPAKKTTSPEVAAKASANLQSKDTGKNTKTASASALSQAKGSKK
ncbi:MAG: hypothetical protein KY445_08075 [Armatimonadetes bacterium]|nr:hypothetical protein [Armatimonadota bacterium]